jgi:excinuclease UvrABC ATPase subunit
LLAPLVVNRKGVYTDLAKWAKARGNTHLRVDGEFLPVDPWPRLDRFREHTIELPVGDIVVSPDNEAELRALLEQTLELGKGVMHLLARSMDCTTRCREARTPGTWAKRRCFRPSAPVRSAAPAIRSLIPACSRTTASMAGATLRGHGSGADTRAACRV